MRWAWLAMVMAAAACGGEAIRERAPVPDLAAPVDAQDLAEELTRAVCALETRCQLAPVTGFQRCLESYPRWLGGSTTFNTPQGLEDAVLAHKVRMDPLRARQCLNAIPSLSCERSSSVLDSGACVSAFTGTVPPGGACIVDQSCAGGSLCEGVSASDACSGRCIERGVACRSERDCAENSVCENRRCVRAEVPAGGRGEPCGSHDRCADGLACVLAPEGPTCAPPPGERERCASGGVCAAGLSCVRDGSQGGSCQRPPPAEPDARCALEAPWTCGPELVCVPDESFVGGTCRRPHVEGDSCASLYDCGGLFSGWICDLSARRCVERPREGACVGGSPYGCDLDHAYCDLDAPGGPTCRAFKATGEACATRDECGPISGGPDCLDTAAGRVCVPLIRELCDP